MLCACEKGMSVLWCCVSMPARQYIIMSLCYGKARLAATCLYQGAFPGLFVSRLPKENTRRGIGL